MGDLLHAALVVIGTVAAVIVVLAIIGYTIVPFIVRMSGLDREGVGRDLDDPVWAGKFAVSIPVTANVTIQQARAIAFAAIQQTGGRDVEEWDSSTIVGWFRRVYNFTADRQLSVVITQNADSSVQFLCCCRPRYTREVLDLGVSRQRATKLAAKVTELAALPSSAAPSASI